MFSNSIELTNKKHHTDDTILTKKIGNWSVIRQGNLLLNDFAIDAFVN